MRKNFSLISCFLGKINAVPERDHHKTRHRRETGREGRLWSTEHLKYRLILIYDYIY
jgi:hypothetical protein